MKILLLESSNRLGGWIQTSQFDDGTVFEHGPRNMRASGKSAVNSLKLVEDLGLENDIIAVPKSHPAAKKRFLYVNKTISALPSGPLGLITKQPPFSKPLALLAWKEPFKRGTPLHDESVYDFFCRLFDKELAEYAADPLCRGIYAGDCRKLSVKSCFPEVFNLEQKYGSLIRGSLLMDRDKTVPTGLVKKSKDEKWSLWTLRHGLSQITRAIVDVLNSDDRFEILIGVKCEKVDFLGPTAKIQYKGKQVEVDHVLSSVPSRNLASIIEDQHSRLATDLRKIPTVSCGVVNLEFEDFKLQLEGFGHLVPSSEPSKVLGMLYESCVFPEHNRKDGRATRLTCMLGGAWFEEYFGNPDNCDLDLLGEVAVTAVKQQLRVDMRPSRIIIRLQKNCIPQYHVGHCDIMEKLDTYIGEHKLPLTLVGASYRGASVNDCISNAKLEVEKLANRNRSS
ncbi:hypothetical protein LSH36_202g03036 [Paralvinella palmiformis]|uniref:Protoporphyrinogen oxidase n=1 Tax=Paralvinella palmiformis TaxID=53620 RepID=A0AAD9JPJ3_9ANNE|nr:hypothetical protein LSH36_202g03036 [Paralvinella palmiformis]